MFQNSLFCYDRTGYRNEGHTTVQVFGNSLNSTKKKVFVLLIPLLLFSLHKYNHPFVQLKISTYRKKDFVKFPLQDNNKIKFGQSRHVRFS